VDQGFAQLLRGSGLAAQRGSAGYTLVPAAAPAAAVASATTAASPATAGGATLTAVTVSAAAERSATTEGTGSYTTRQTHTATRLALAPRETPQSVSVITRQRIEDQGLTQLTDVIAQTPGLILAQGGNTGSDSSPIYSRGFGVDTYMVDGIRQLNSGYTDMFQTYDVATVDRVEVLRGASGLINGIGTPGAAVNLIRKRPTSAFQAKVRAELGSWAHRRAEVDISTPLNDAGNVRGRFVAAVQKNNSYIDRLKEDREVLYGVVEADVTRDTRAHAGLSYQRFEATGHARGGLPAYFSDGTRTNWAVSDSAAAEWASSYRRYGSVFAGVEHQLAPDWSVKGTV
ncbi:MAG: TonB-dependent siderophore receptor, partial [Comamonadaceae bacterium]